MDVSKNALNALIMNYLIVEGYQDAAAKFVQEANINLANPSYGLASPTLYGSTTTPTFTSPTTGNSSSNNEQSLNSADNETTAEHLRSVRDRMVIKSLILTGQIQSAIEKINDLDPELLDADGNLHFALLRLQLIELIRTANNSTGDITPALQFASTHLALRAPSNPVFLADLERTMALLCFPPDNLVPQLKDLMDLKLRETVARDVNTTLLKSQGIDGETKIVNLVKLWGWAQQELEKENVVFPGLSKSTLQ